MSGADWEQVRERLAGETAAAEAALAASSTKNERVDLLLALAERLRVCDGERTQALLREARDLAHAAGYPEGQAFSLAELSRHAMSVSNLDETARLCFEALELLKGRPNCSALASVHLQLGWMYDYLGDYSAAMDWGLKGLEIARGLSRETGGVALTRIHARLLDLIGCIHSQMEDHDAATQYHAEAMAVVDPASDLYTRAAILNNRAMTLLYAGDLEGALETGTQCLETGRALGMDRQVSNYADTVGEVLMAMNRLSQADEVLREALEISLKQPLDISQGYILKNLGRVCMLRGNQEAAAGYLQQATELMEKLNVRGELALCHQLMSEVRERQGNPTRALEHFKTFYALREATSGRESARRLAALKTTYDIQLAQRDAEIERLRNVELQAEIEERKRIQAVLEKLATVDIMTGLFNRRHFFVLAEREVERALRYSHPLALMMVDIDHFKRVNDTLGHVAGDQVLVAIGQAIQGSLREVDIAGRYGGEEFAILLPETPVENATRAAERLRAAIAAMAVDTDNGRVSVTASVGVSGLWENSQNCTRELAAMLDRADRALYGAKRAGRNATHVQALHK
jgi:diguanylate cyclase (GGDEF)-like protein